MSLVLDILLSVEIAAVELPRVDIIHDDSSTYPMQPDTDYNGTLTAQNGQGKIYNTLYNGPVQFSVGGNYTATLPKKPINLKLKNSGGSTINVPLLDMQPSSEEFRLLANYDDPLVGLRNQILFDTAASEVLYTPKYRWVEVWEDNHSKGLYMLAQRTKRGSALPKSVLVAMPNGGTPGQGGMAWELDNYTDVGEAYIDTVQQGVHIKWNYPNKSSVTTAHQAYGVQLFSDMESAFSVGDMSMIDVGSFARIHVIHAMMLNRDAFNGSTYYFKPVGGLITACCAWDGTLTLANPLPVIADEPQWKDPEFEPFLNDSTRGWNDILWTIPAYRSAFVSAFSSIRPKIEAAVISARSTYESFKANGIYVRNATTWTFYGIPYTPEYMDTQMDVLETFISARLNYIQSQIDIL